MQVKSPIIEHLRKLKLLSFLDLPFCLQNFQSRLNPSNRLHLSFKNLLIFSELDDQFSVRILFVSDRKDLMLSANAHDLADHVSIQKRTALGIFNQSGVEGAAVGDFYVFSLLFCLFLRFLGLAFHGR